MKVDVIHVSGMTEKSADDPSTAWDRHGNMMTIRKLIRPSLLSMAACGCYTYDGDYIKQGRETAAGRPYRIFGVVYRTFCLLMCLTACAKAGAAFTTIPAKFVQLTVVMCIWFVQTLVVFLISLKSNHSRYGGQRKALDFWDFKVFHDMEALGIKVPADKIRKRQKICLLFAVSICMANITCLSLLSADVFSKDFDVFFSAPFASSVPVLVIEMGILTVITIIWTVPVFYIILISSVFTFTFEVFNKFLENHIEKNSATMTCQFQKIRTLHLNLSKAVTYMDEDFGCYFAALFVFSIGLACFILYLILKTPMDTITIVTFLFWMSAPLVLLGSVSVFAAFVNEAVSILFR